MQIQYQDKKLDQAANFSIVPGTSLKCSHHRVTVLAGTATSGTVALKCKSWANGSGVSEPVLDAYGVAIVATISAGSAKTFLFENDVESYDFELTSANGTINVYVSAW